MGRPAGAEPFYRDRVAAAKQKAGADSLAYAGALVTLGVNLIAQERFADAEPVVREALTVRAAKDPTGWGTANTRSILGRALLGQKRYADAEPLLTAGYDELKAKAKSIPAVVRRQRLDEALTGLADLAAARGDATAAAKWAAERASLPRELAPPPRPAGG
jgi:eukaryotic-like serine/threonine-protein kinase